MKTRPTISDIAKSAGVSVATVDRVINARLPVRKKTTDRILSAAKQLHYHGYDLIRQRKESMTSSFRLSIILQKKTKIFYQNLASELYTCAENSSRANVHVNIIFVDKISPEYLIDALKELQNQSDAIGIVSIDHQLIHAEIERLKQNEIPVFALLTDLNTSATSGFIGVNARKAGRTAGWGMSRLVSKNSEVGILIGSHRYLSHEDRETGFRSYMREHASKVILRDSVVYMDDADIAYEATMEIIKKVPQLSGIYHCGGGISGAIAALDQTNRSRDIVYICHDETAHVTNGLINGSVDLSIANPTREIAEKTIETILNYLLSSRKERIKTTVPFKILTSENI